MYIYQKPTLTGVDNCVVLLPQENFYSPFSTQIGDWTEIRVGAYLSLCGASGFNSFPSIETIHTNTTPQCGWYFGIGNFINSAIPYSSGCNFAGISSYASGDGNSVTTQISEAVGTNGCFSVAGSDVSRNYYFASNDLSFNYGQYQLAGAGYNSTPAFPTGSSNTTNFAVSTLLRYRIINKNTVGQQIILNVALDVASTPNATSNTDSNSLRIAMMNLSTVTSNLTLYYTTGCSVTGGPLPLPNTVFFHSPFFNNYLRIHNLLVEKYA